jgi:hypothetical protein
MPFCRVSFCELRRQLYVTVCSFYLHCKLAEGESGECHAHTFTLPRMLRCAQCWWHLLYTALRQPECACMAGPHHDRLRPSTLQACPIGSLLHDCTCQQLHELVN